MAAVPLSSIQQPLPLLSLPSPSRHSPPSHLSLSLSSSHAFSSSSPLSPFIHSPFRIPPHSSTSPHLPFISADLSSQDTPLRVMISGPPASGKGTQCELIVKHHGLVHISAGDLLRAEVAAGTESGKRAKECMTRGDLVPNEIVVKMVKDRLSQPDAQAKGWLLDGYPRSQAQAEAIVAEGIRPDVFIVLEVPEDILIERVIGRRLDPVTGRIYHLIYSPPESKEIEERLIQRFDDTEHQAKLRLQTHSQNVDAVLKMYKEIAKKVDGNRPKGEVYREIDKVLSDFRKEKSDPRFAAAGS